MYCIVRYFISSVNGDATLAISSYSQLHLLPYHYYHYYSTISLHALLYLYAHTHKCVIIIIISICSHIIHTSRYVLHTYNAIVYSSHDIAFHTYDKRDTTPYAWQQKHSYATFMHLYHTHHIFI